MRFRVFSDLHVDVNGGLAVPLNLDDCDAVIIAGDVCERLATRVLAWLVENVQPCGVPVVYVPGNHDFYSKRFPAELDAAVFAFESAGIHLLARGEGVQVGDVMVVGATLWTDFRVAGDRHQAMLAAADRRTGMNDHRRIRFGDGSRPFLPSDAIAEHEAAAAAITRACRNAREPADRPVDGWAAAELLVDRKGSQPVAEMLSPGGEVSNVVVVTHHAPSPRSLRGGAVCEILDAAYASDLETLIADLKPAAWVHGHVHRSVDYMLGATRVVSNPMGYVTQFGRGKARMQVENPDFAPGFTLVVGDEIPAADLDALHL